MLQYDILKVPNAICKIDVSKEEFDKFYGDDKKEKTQLNEFNQINISGGKYWRLNPVTNMLIFACGITIGIKEITENNYKNVYNRISIYEKIFGSFIIQSYIDSETKTKTNKERPITLQDIKNHIGLIVYNNNKKVELNKGEFLEKLNRKLQEINF